VESSRQNAAVTASEVPEASDNRSSLQQDSLPDPNLFWSLASNQQQQTQDQPAASVGPSKARVDLPPLQLSEPASQPNQASQALNQAAPTASDAAPSAQAPTPAPAPSLASDDDSSKSAPSGPLGPAEQLNNLTLETLSQNIIGVAFAPVQVATGPSDASAASRQKNFIFSERKMFADEATITKIAVQPSGTFAAAQRATSHAASVPFEPPPASGKFAAASRSSDTQNSSRESFYQRAQAIADALGGSNSPNPQVKKLLTDLENYRTTALTPPGANAHPSGRPSVVITA
jgi:hypothetical protein